MFSNVSPTQSPIVWDKKTVLENAVTFLAQKKEELNLYQNLWNASKGTEYYNPLAKIAAEKFKASAEKSRNEIEVLDNNVTQLLDAELAKNPSSEQAIQLSKIALASRCGLNFFTSAVKDTYYPTHLNWFLREAALTSNKLAFCATVITGAAYFTKCVTDFEIPFYSSTPWKVSMAAFAAFNAIRFLNNCYRADPAKEKVAALECIFEQTLAPQKAALKTVA